MKKKFAHAIGNSWTQRISILVAFFIIMAIGNPKFFIPSNLKSVLLSISIYGVMACGFLFSMITGGIDFSIGSVAALSACIICKVSLATDNSVGGFLLGLLIAMAICAVIGLFHGFQVAYFGMPSFVITLATKYLIYGIAYIYSGGVYLIPKSEGLFFGIAHSQLLGIPLPIIWMVLFVAACIFVLSRTTFGRRCYFVGGNRRSSELVGIKSKRVVVTSFILCSVAAGIGGILLASLNAQANASTASGYEGKVLTAMVVGGVDLGGGAGGMGAVIYGALFVGMLNNMLVLLDVPSEYQNLIQGAIIIAALAFNYFTKRKSMQMLNEAAKLENAAERDAERARDDERHKKAQAGDGSDSGI